MSHIGIMQGRLSSPKDNRIQFFPENWEREFELASLAQFDCIEWLYDFHDANMNPIATDEGIETIKSLMQHHNVKVDSLCAHCFIEKPLVGACAGKKNESFSLLGWLLRRLKMLGSARLVLPLEDAAYLSDGAEFNRQVEWMKRALNLAEKNQIEIDLETTLSPLILASFLDKLPHPFLKVNYDIGNSAGMGYDICDEFAAYGHRIGSVHIKDKLLDGPTVALGKGIADFQLLASCLENINFTGDIILEAARGIPGEELTWAKNNRSLVLKYVLRSET
ncbi:MAG TPA: TIM barrel protein [Smithella sp.]|nr:TIM barrel protein [Smithella sp.]